MIRRTIIGLAVSLASCGAVTATASASSLTVTQAIRAQEKIVHASPAYKALKGFGKITTVSQAEKAIPEFRGLSKLLSKAADSVAQASATADQKVGQKDWVSGVRLLSKGIRDLTVALIDIEHGHPTAAKAMAIKGDKLANTGNALGTKGEKLLGVKTGG